MGVTPRVRLNMTMNALALSYPTSRATAVTGDRRPGDAELAAVAIAAAISEGRARFFLKQPLQCPDAERHSLGHLFDDAGIVGMRSSRAPAIAPVRPMARVVAEEWSAKH
jgi:hypothetical protein